ncbi:hypothetical protein [Croceivirga thetidis]|uniref:Uncharacterized protein n=1 Tax=Croceivirga thetidis TaxID=2721623 RepID=A0ABX1GLG6_9FLAO|nr:hypothetical protein [Croceivirga thetidis]NKI30718.1 hypothetical protein [Croceivirga thetidis]
MQLPESINNGIRWLNRIRKEIRIRRKRTYRKAWLMWPFKFLWVNWLVIRRLLLFPFKDYGKLSPFARVVGPLSTLFLGLFLFIVIKKSNETDKVIYTQRVYEKFECELVSNSQKTVQVGHSHQVEYSLPCYENVPINILYSSGYGSIVIRETVRNGIIEYNTPELITEKIGDYEINLMYGEESILKDSLKVITEPKDIDYIESYFGPRIILAGGNDFSMLTVIPVDDYDNPMPDETRIEVHENFKETQKVHEQYTFDFVSFRRFYSYNQTGKITVSMNTDNGITTKEKTSDIYPYSPKDFTIEQSKEHNFADGNEVVSIKTSIIEDIYGNIIQNGTMVHYQIVTKSGKQLAAFAKTVKGIATAKIQHPYTEDSWTIQAFIPGLAESNSLEIDFEQIAYDFPLTFFKENREIQVGPIKSYMGQLLPNGTAVTLTLQHNGKTSEITQYTVGAMTTFVLRDFYFPSGEYKMTLETLGLTKQFEKTLSDEKE